MTLRSGGTCTARHQTQDLRGFPVVIEPARRRSRYLDEQGDRVVAIPVYSPYPPSYPPESIYGHTPCELGSIVHTEHVNGTNVATIDWQVVDPASAPGRRIPLWQVRSFGFSARR